jgi:signal transduction histidine kinase
MSAELQQDNERLRQQNARLLAALTEIEKKLSEPEEIIRAIRRGEVEALVVQEQGEDKIYSLQAVEQLRALASEITLAEQRQRRNLAKVLHDCLQQSLVALKFQVSHLADGTSPDPQATIRRINELLDESLNTSRSLTDDLSPPLDQAEDLLATLEWLARWMEGRHGLTVVLDVERASPLLPEDTRILLFESIRELLFNVVKHAGTRSASIIVRREKPEQLRVTVKDEGQGFDPVVLKQRHPRRGLGLFSIRERIALLAGHMEVASAPGKGCHVSLTVPVVTAVKS